MLSGWKKKDGRPPTRSRVKNEDMWRALDVHHDRQTSLGVGWPVTPAISENETRRQAGAGSIPRKRANT